MGKASSLGRLTAAGFHVPPFFVVGPTDAIDAPTLERRCMALAAGSEPRFAVRSSAAVEDGENASYAGMFDTFLFVRPADVAERVRDVRASANSARATAYAAQHGERVDIAPAAIVQVMVDADVAGVAFGRDPVDGSDRIVIGSAYGMGSGIVGGDCATDTYRVARDWTVTQTIVNKPIAHRRAETAAGVAIADIDAQRAQMPSLSEAQAREIATTVRAISAKFGAPQDVEWALAGGSLSILQARPVTTPPGIIWDNSNISESYGGIVLPLTDSFVRRAYAGAYRQFMRALAIPESAIANADAIEGLLGLVDGRMYYNLLNWYRLLALIPGFRLNRTFMETMMGVSEALPDETVRALAATSATRDALAVAKSAGALLRQLIALPRENRRFHALIARTLHDAPDLHGADLDALESEYARLEALLLANWQAPLVNDFFAMIFYGILRKLTAGLETSDGEPVHNDLLCGEGGMVSTEPARDVLQLARIARGDTAMLAAFSTGDDAATTTALRQRPDLAAGIEAYLERFGDRCQSELKLESRTLRDDPSSLYRAIARLAESGSATVAPDRQRVRRAAEQTANAALRGKPLRALLFRFILGQARARVRDRENLRFERTRVFAHVRRVFLEAGLRLCEAGDLDDPRDIFYLSVEDVRGAIASPEHRASLRGIVTQQCAKYEAYATQPAPPDRFTSIDDRAPAAIAARAIDGDVAIGTGCCPGIVRARVRIVTDPQTPLERGEILVAERTDPGWILLFPAAAGILVERGSVLSHAAIVSREMGIPSVVGLPGLTRWLRDGDLVELDGRAGSVRLIERAAAAQ